MLLFGQHSLRVLFKHLPSDSIQTPQLLQDHCPTTLDLATAVMKKSKKDKGRALLASQGMGARMTKIKNGVPAYY